MELKVQTRNKFGKSVKTLRRLGLAPAELYGHGIQNLHLSAPAKDMEKIWKNAGRNQIVSLIVDEKEKKPVLIQNLVRNPLTSEILNVDFYEVRADEKIRARVPIEFIGIAPAVKNLGGIFVKAVEELEIEALPRNLPAKIEIDITFLDQIGKSVYIRDLKINPEAKITQGGLTAIASIIAPKAEAQEETETEAAATSETAEKTSEKTPKTGEQQKEKAGGKKEKTGNKV